MQRKRTSKPTRQAPVTPGETRLSEEIALAQAGDTFAARDLVVTLRNSVLFSQSRQSPLAAAEAAYLARALTDIAEGMDANRAFNLKSNGPPRKWPHAAKVLAVSIMNQFIKEGLSIDHAAAEGSNAVNQFVEALAARRRAYFQAQKSGKKASIDPMDLITDWNSFIDRPPLNIDSLEPMKSWYLELLNPMKKPRKRSSHRK